MVTKKRNRGSARTGNTGEGPGYESGNVRLAGMAKSGPAREVTLSLNRWRLALKRLDGVIGQCRREIEAGGKGVRLDQRPIGSMLQDIGKRIETYHKALDLHRRLLGFKWLLRSRIAAKNQELGVSDLLCEQAVTQNRLDVLNRQALERPNDFRVGIEEVPELFQASLEGQRNVKSERQSSQDAGTMDELEESLFRNREYTETWTSRSAVGGLTVETLPETMRVALVEEYRGLMRRLVDIGDEIADSNSARLTLEVAVEIAEAIQV